MRCVRWEEAWPSKKIIDQYPFPGPGLAVRITGPVTEENIKICRDASAIVEGT